MSYKDKMLHYQHKDLFLENIHLSKINCYACTAKTFILGGEVGCFSMSGTAASEIWATFSIFRQHFACIWTRLSKCFG